MRKPFIVLAILIGATAIACATDFYPGLMRDTFVGKWDVTLTPDDDAHKAGERDLADTFTFKGGQFTSADFAKKGFASVSYDEDTRLGDVGTFTATQKSDDQGTLKWAGTVSVDQMTGDLTWTKKDGTALHYTIKGTKQ